jgi:DNA mismatch repair protein MutL
MPVIKTLPDDVARRIAAGEVVERPASVVKELFENAIDAGATRVSVVTTGAGETLIEVRDNGGGMVREDVEMAPRNFSTSKIARSEDLEHIGTYGFRGEALASISSVSRFEIISSAGDGGEGWRVVVEGKDAVTSEPAPHERGTTVRVRDLFFNTPARKRFLKTALTERKRILEAILSFALVLPDVEIHYMDDGRHVLDLLPAASWRERVAAVLGASTMKHMVEIESDPDRRGPQIRGFVSLPTHTRANRNHQFFFVNRRSVREKTLAHALQDAYRNVIPYRRFPVAVLALDVAPEQVDVNVHPSKMEVRIHNERALFGILRGAVKTALSARSESSLSVSMASEAGTAGTEAGEADRTPREYVSHPRETDGELFERPATQRPKVISLQERIRDAYVHYEHNRPEAAPSNPQLSLRDTPEKDEGTREAVENLKQRSPGDDALFWQFNNSYIFIQVRGGMVVIDQHAAHERIIFDSSKRQLENQAPPSQQILFSIHLELSLRELEVFRSSRPVFEKLGFNLEPFGGKSILVRGYPQGLKNWEEGKLLLQMFDDILQDRVPGDTITDKLVASFACRSAIKAGQKLSVQEMKLLADQLFAADNPYSCPHGRPTIHRLSVEEIEKWFLRR